MHSRSRRRALQVGGLGLFGLSLADVERLAEGAATAGSPSTHRSVLLVYLPGGLSHIDSFDPKPLASARTRGEFDVIQTRVPDLRICEHLPRLAARSDRWSLVRSFGHPTNDHTQAHHYVLCGKMELPSPFDRAKPIASDFPSMTAVAGSKLDAPGPLPSAAMLPRLLINVARQVRGGQTAGRMGERHDPWLLKAAAQCNQYGSCPDCFMFSNMKTHKHAGFPVLRAPNPRRPQDVTIRRLDRRSNLLDELEQQQRQLERFASVQRFGRQRERAMSLLTSQTVTPARWPATATTCSAGRCCCPSG